MDKKPPEHWEGYGRLPAMAPLANPYVPYQMENPEQYEASKGIVRGTLYPGLDLPFKGMVNKKPLPDTPMARMQSLNFAIQELALYLDTHQEDMEAFELYRRYQQMYSRSKAEYEKAHGPLCHTTPTDATKYQWLSDPWPWEYSANKEG